MTKAQVTRPWHHQEEDKEAHPCYDETWHREGQTPVVLHGKGKVIFLPIYGYVNLLYFLLRYLYFSHLDECSSYEATEDVPEAGVAVPEAHDQAPGKEVSAEETTNADLDSDDNFSEIFCPMFPS